MVPTIQITDVRRENPQDSAFAELEILFSAAASIEAIKIFFAAKDGIKSSTQAIRDLDLTQKKYYTHLKRLIDAGLVDRVNGVYQHTTLGKIGFKLAEAFMNVVIQKDRLDLIDRLSKAKNITLDETEEIMRAILKDTNIIPGDRITDILGPVRMADTWEKLVNDVTEQIHKAEKEIFFVSRYYELRTTDALLKALEKGVDIHLLIPKELNVMKEIGLITSLLFTNPNAVRNFLNLLRSPNLKIRKSENIPYSFMVIDGKYCMIEVVTPVEKAFSLAFLFRGESIIRRMSESFKKLWDAGIEVNLLNDQKDRVSAT